MVEQMYFVPDDTVLVVLSGAPPGSVTSEMLWAMRRKLPKGIGLVYLQGGVTLDALSDGDLARAGLRRIDSDG